MARNNPMTKTERKQMNKLNARLKGGEKIFDKLMARQSKIRKQQEKLIKRAKARAQKRSKK